MSPRLVLYLLLPLAATAQAQPDTVFRADVELRQIEVRVTGKDGSPVMGLSAEDFRLIEDGDEQMIASIDFMPESRSLPPVAEDENAVPAPVALPERPAPTPPTWVYIATQSSVRDFPNVNEAIERFLREELREGMRVSIGGAPFTADRLRLLRIAEAMRKSPFGRRPDFYGNWLPATADMTQATIDALEYERSEAADPTTEPGAAQEPGARLTTDFDNQIDSFYRVHLYRYLDLIRELGVYPGKKVVVLFRGGLRSDVNNFDVLARIAGEAVRSRVAFYTVDSRGAEPILPVADGFSERRVRRLRGPTGAGGRQTLTQEEMERFSQAQQGLVQLANMTGGRAVVNSNDLSLVFDRLAEDAGGYYLLSYAPRHQGKPRTRHHVKVRIDRPGVKVDTAGVYYDRKPYEEMSESERELDLHRTLLSGESPSDLQLRFDAGFYREDDRTVMVFSLAVPAESVSQAEGSVELGVALQAEDPAGLRPQQFQHTLLKYDGERLKSERYVRYAGSLPLEPGRRRFRILVRDDRTGRGGLLATEIEAPDLSQPLAASTILLSSLTEPAEGSDWSMFAVAGRTLIPASPREFRVGEPIYALFDVYDPPTEVAQHPQAFRMALIRDGKPVDGVAAKSEVYLDGERGALRYFASLDTAKLEPGRYSLFALLPKEGDPYIYRTFELLAP